MREMLIYIIMNACSVPVQRNQQLGSGAGCRRDNWRDRESQVGFLPSMVQLLWEGLGLEIDK